MPSPRKLSELRNRIIKLNRSPNSVSSGGRMFGRISRHSSQLNLSPRRRAASKKSEFETDIATARLTRKTRVKSKNAITRISVTIPGGKTESATSAKIKVGNAISRSTVRERTPSVIPRRTAASSPVESPAKNEISVAANAVRMVTRAP